MHASGNLQKQLDVEMCNLDTVLSIHRLSQVFMAIVRKRVKPIYNF